mmetsp:Transcript_139864/g.389777  ORF Transcript_139864/g.389777 Transcript_139864/m.389777 type:complete len:603 (+) Transcript_139864:62-1870(+)
MARISVAREVQRPQDYASDGTDAVGFVQFWGNSPALDLLGDDPQARAIGPAAIGTSPGQIYKDEKVSAEDAETVADEEDFGTEQAEEEPQASLLPEDVVSVLISGGADIRHVVKSLARWRANGRRLRLFLHESHHEALARHFLFLQVINNTALPVRERMELFLSLYGNTLVRERDTTYVEEIAPEFIELITDNSSHPLAGVIDLTHLKFKDRDAFQEIFKGWLKDVPFDVEAMREQRCRGYYRERYDHRKNLFDFDYQSHIKPKAGIISWYHYKEFCFTGVAFETRLASYNVPNRTLASYTEGVDRTKGTTVQVRGFWGDIINSPYHAFGTTTEAEDRSRLFKISGGMYRHTETDVAEFNLSSFLGEMETGQRLHLPPERPEEHMYPYASPLEEMRAADKVQEVAEAAAEAKAAAAAKASAGRRRGARRTDWPPLVPAFEGVEVIPLAGDLRDVLKKPKYRGLFHRAFIGSMAMMPWLEEFGITKGGEDPFRSKEGTRIRKPPRLEAPELFGKKRAESVLATAMADGAEVVFETMKYQAHFDAMMRLGYRHRVAQVGHLAGWCLADERHALPRIEHDMKENRARELEKDATDFMRFVVTPSS